MVLCGVDGNREADVTPFHRRGGEMYFFAAIDELP